MVSGNYRVKVLSCIFPGKSVLTNAADTTYKPTHRQNSKRSKVALNRRLLLRSEKYSSSMPTICRARYASEISGHTMEGPATFGTLYKLELLCSPTRRYLTAAHSAVQVHLHTVLHLSHTHTHTSTRALVVKSRSVNGWPWFYVRVKFWIEKCYDF